MEDQLLTGPFGDLSHSSDSVFIRNFYVTDCGNILGVYTSHDLKDNEEMLKKKLNVRFIQFQDKKDFSWNNPIENKYKLVYHTWTHHSDHWTLYDFFSARQTEELIINKKHFYRRETTYRWILFFWTKSFEFIESTERVGGKGRLLTKAIMYLPSFVYFYFGKANAL